MSKSSFTRIKEGSGPAIGLSLPTDPARDRACAADPTDSADCDAERDNFDPEVVGRISPPLLEVLPLDAVSFSTRSRSRSTVGTGRKLSIS